MKSNIKKVCTILALMTVCLSAAPTAFAAESQPLPSAYTAQSGATVYTNLRRGSRGSSVKKLQKRLNALGYSCGTADGIFGKKTRSAVLAFQRANSLSADGIAGRKTQTKLYSSSAKSKGSASKTQTVAASNSASNTDNVYYDIKLSRSQQDYVRQMCSKYKVDFELVLAIMWVESGYNPKSVSSTRDYGIMQINKSNHAYIKKQTGVTNFLDFEQNTQAGVYWLSRYAKKYSDVHKLAMCYNLGEGAAKKQWAKGNTTNSYSRNVAAKLKELEKLKK